MQQIRHQWTEKNYNMIYGITTLLSAVHEKSHKIGKNTAGKAHAKCGHFNKTRINTRCTPLNVDMSYVMSSPGGGGDSCNRVTCNVA